MNEELSRAHFGNSAPERIAITREGAGQAEIPFSSRREALIANKTAMAELRSSRKLVAEINNHANPSVLVDDESECKKFLRDIGFTDDYDPHEVAALVKAPKEETLH